MIQAGYRRTVLTENSEKEPEEEWAIRFLEKRKKAQNLSEEETGNNTIAL
ncbi:MAG: hypothetical protein ACRDF4_07600 [Rhabdochlamydiaceae bacterium]